MADTGAPVMDATLTLTNAPQFNRVNPETPGPPYQWFFGDIPEGWEGVEGVVGFHDYQDTYTPGFDVSRSATPTVFSGPGTQTLTVTVIPRNPPGNVNIDVRVSEDEHVIPTITSAVAVTAGAEVVYLAPDGHQAFITIPVPVDGTPYTLEITTQVVLKPGVSQVEFMPWVGTHSNEQYGGVAEGVPSVSHDMLPDVGTWTWSATGVITIPGTGTRMW